MSCEFINGKKVTKENFGKIKSGHYIRHAHEFGNWITIDGSSGYLAEPNRYHLYFSYACPWAHRTLIMLKLKKLDKVISSSKLLPVFKEDSWEFQPNSDAADPLYNFRYAYELYLKTDPNYTGRITVPILFDKKKEVIVNNESAKIIRMFNQAFIDYADPYDYYPASLQAEINEVNDYIYQNINNGVYRCGFAKTQEAYNSAFAALFKALDTIEERLTNMEYLVGNVFTEADIRLFTTLVRFDAVYYSHFKCNLKRIVDYPNLNAYLIRIYNIPGVKETVNMSDIKQHYFRSHPNINPLGIVPEGPYLPWL